MAALLPRVTGRGFHTGEQCPTNKAVHNEIIEISSDDDSDAGDLIPYFPKHPQLATSTARDGATTLPVGQHNLGMAREMEGWSPNYIRQPKRQKLDTGDRTLTSQNNPDRFSTQDTQPEVPDLLFPKLNELDYSNIHPPSDYLAYADNSAASTFSAGPSNTDHTQRDYWLDATHENFDQLWPTANITHELPSAKKTSTAPYLDDPILQVRLYCGQGYEKFPIVLGTKPGHQSVCDRWDKRAATRLQRRHETQRVTTDMGSYIDERLVVDSEDDSDNDEKAQKAEESACLLQILEILPDIEHDFVKQKINARIQYLGNVQDGDDMEILPGADEIMAEILEEKSYPKQPAPEHEAEDGTGITIIFEKETIQSAKYLTDSVIILANHFDHVPTSHVHKTMHQKKSLFDSFKEIHTQELAYGTTRDKPYRRLRLPRTVLEKKYSAVGGMIVVDKCWKNLVNELQAAKQAIERERLRALHTKELADTEAANLQHHIDRNDCFECQCCFDGEVPNNRAVICTSSDDVHSFCYSCVKSLAKNQLGMMKHELLCMDGSGCKASLSTDGIAEAVPQQIVEKLAYYQQQAEIVAANIEGLEQCHFCDFKGICDPVEVDPIFRCYNPDCGRIACRKCHEESHGSRSCEEVKTDKGLSARHKVEEARSEAMVRPCPGCHVKMVKTGGCNKIICTMCGCMSCFVCKKDISDKREGGYQHFHGPGSKCSLHDVGNFDRHNHDADEAEKQAIMKVRAENADLDEAQLRIETGKGTSSNAGSSVPGVRHPVVPFQQFVPDVHMHMPPLQPILPPRLDGHRMQEMNSERQRHYMAEPVQPALPIAAPRRETQERVSQAAERVRVRLQASMNNIQRIEARRAALDDRGGRLAVTTQQRGFPSLAPAPAKLIVDDLPPPQRKYDLADTDWIWGPGRVMNPALYQNMFPHQDLDNVRPTKPSVDDSGLIQAPVPATNTTDDIRHGYATQPPLSRLTNQHPAGLPGTAYGQHGNIDMLDYAINHGLW